MKIHSKFKDYYDSVQMHGQDETVHYIRTTESMVYPKGLKDKLFEYTRTITVYYLIGNTCIVGLVPCIILFCGKVYRGFRLMEYNTKYQNPYKSLNKTFYTKESAIEYYNANVSETRKSRHYYFDDIPDKTAITNWLANQATNELEDYACKNKIVVAAIDHNIIKNPCLSDYDFFKAVEPYTAYQELDMYISGVLSKEPNMMVQISDKDRISQHGFDKWSFRKLPTKNK